MKGVGSSSKDPLKTLGLPRIVDFLGIEVTKALLEVALEL